MPEARRRDDAARTRLATATTAPSVTSAASRSRPMLVRTVVAMPSMANAACARAITRSTSAPVAASAAAVGEGEHRLRHRDDDADEQSAEDGREARAAGDVGAHRVAVAPLGLRARQHRKEDERDAEEQLVREEGEGLALLVDGEPLLHAPALRLARRGRRRRRLR